jgi:hypothetical protein
MTHLAPTSTLVYVGIISDAVERHGNETNTNVGMT